jgi:hypothetical protein
MVTRPLPLKERLPVTPRRRRVLELGSLLLNSIGILFALWCVGALVGVVRLGYCMVAGC